MARRCLARTLHWDGGLKSDAWGGGWDGAWTYGSHKIGRVPSPTVAALVLRSFPPSPYSLRAAAFMGKGPPPTLLPDLLLQRRVAPP